MTRTQRPRWIERASRWAVWGIGRSGVAAANLLAQRGHDVVASDPRSADRLAPHLEQLDPTVSVHLGGNVLADAQVVVTSPGLRPSLPVFEQARRAGAPVIPEIELAWDVARAPMLCVTGTDGKTTTTSLLGEIFARAGREHIVAGNIGTPLCQLVESVSARGVIVAEISAFQLWSIHHFRPRVACLTNLAADHLDYFDGSMEEYAAAKRRILENMGPQSWLWLNAHDARTPAWREGFPGQLGLFALAPELVEGHPRAMWRQGEQLWARPGQGADPIAWAPDLEALGLEGAHNHSNMLCAAGMAHCQGVELEVIHEALREFEGLPHRAQPCGQAGSVRFVNDSKATNVHAALAGLRGLEGQPVVPIVGGVDKGLELRPLVRWLRAHARATIVIGELAERLREQLEEAGYDPARLIEADSMASAVRWAWERAAEVDGPATVTLSPACSSFDMFDSYAHRGRVFQDAVAALARSVEPERSDQEG